MYTWSGLPGLAGASHAASDVQHAVHVMLAVNVAVVAMPQVQFQHVILCQPWSTSAFAGGCGSMVSLETQPANWAAEINSCSMRYTNQPACMQYSAIHQTQTPCWQACINHQTTPKQMHKHTAISATAGLHVHYITVLLSDRTRTQLARGDYPLPTS